MTAPAVAAKKTPQKTPRTREVNGGLLRVGNPGNKGGGRLKDVVRSAALEGAQKAVPRLVSMLGADACKHCGHSPTADDQTVTRAADVLLKYGLGQTKEVTVDNVRQRVQQTLDTIQRLAPPELAAQLIAALQPVWS